ncbi:MAG: hypothetical protein V3U78_04580 [Thiotrichaceae bacterium]
MKTWNQETKDHWIEKTNIIYKNREFSESDFFNGIIEPYWLFSLSKKILNNLPMDEYFLFPYQLCKAIPVDTSIDNVAYNMAILRLIEFNENSPIIKKAINHFKLKIKGEKPKWLTANDIADYGNVCAIETMDQLSELGAGGGRYPSIASSILADRIYENTIKNELAEHAHNKIDQIISSRLYRFGISIDCDRSYKDIIEKARNKTTYFWQKQRKNLIRLLEELTPH